MSRMTSTAAWAVATAASATAMARFWSTLVASAGGFIAEVPAVVLAEVILVVVLFFASLCCIVVTCGEDFLNIHLCFPLACTSSQTKLSPVI